MSRPRVYGSDNERLQAWRERKRQEKQEREQEQTEEPEVPTTEGDDRTARQTIQQRLDMTVMRLEYIGDCMILKGLCSRAEATDMQVLIRIALQDPGLVEKWRQERANVPLRGLIPWQED